MREAVKVRRFKSKIKLVVKQIKSMKRHTTRSWSSFQDKLRSKLKVRKYGIKYENAIFWQISYVLPTFSSPGVLDA